MLGESIEQIENRENEINRLLVALENTRIRNITHEKRRKALAEELYEIGYRIPDDKSCSTVLGVVIERIKALGVYSSLNSQYAPPELKSKSDKGIFISFEQLEEVEKWVSLK